MLRTGGPAAVGPPPSAPRRRLWMMVVCAACGQENPEIARFCLAWTPSGARGRAARGAPIRQRRLRRHGRVHVALGAERPGGRPVATAAVPRCGPRRDRVLRRRGREVHRRRGRRHVRRPGRLRRRRGASGPSGPRRPKHDRSDGRVRQAARFEGSHRGQYRRGARDRRCEAGARGGDGHGRRRQYRRAAPGRRAGRGRPRRRGDVPHNQGRDPLLAEPRHRGEGEEKPVPAWVALDEARLPGDRPVRGPLVGRRPRARRHPWTWERVASDRRPHLVTIIGPAGVGKTRLGKEFGAMVRERGGRTVPGRTLPYRESTAYSALAFQLKQLCGIFETDSIELASKKLADSVARLIPPAEASDVAKHLAIVLGLDPAGTIADRESLFVSIRSFIEAVAADRPTMLVFEDLHWADVALLDLVELLAARLRDLPVLLLVLARPDLFDIRPGWGGAARAHCAAARAPRPRRRSRARDPSAGRERGDGEHRAGGGPRSDRRRQSVVHRAARGRRRGVRRPLRPASDDGSRDHRGAARRCRGASARSCWTPPSPAASSGVAPSSAWSPTPDDRETLGELERRELIAPEGLSVRGSAAVRSITCSSGMWRTSCYRVRRGGTAIVRRRSSSRRSAASRVRWFRRSRVTGATPASPRRPSTISSRRPRSPSTAGRKSAAALYREALGLVPETDGDRRRQLTLSIALAETATYHVADARLLGRD